MDIVNSADTQERCESPNTVTDHSICRRRSTVALSSPNPRETIRESRRPMLNVVDQHSERLRINSRESQEARQGLRRGAVEVACEGAGVVTEQVFGECERGVTTRTSVDGDDLAVTFSAFVNGASWGKGGEWYFLNSTWVKGVTAGLGAIL